MTLLVTGAGGFIGQAVARLLSRGSDAGAVRLLDRTPPTCPPGARFTGLGLDLTAPGAAAQALDGIDTVIHLASLPGASAEAAPALSRAVNLDATLQLLEALDARPTPWASPMTATREPDPGRHAPGMSRTA